MEKWEKCALRTAKKQMRKAIDPEQRTLWDSRIVHNIVDNPTYQNAQILMSYCAMGKGVLRHLGARPVSFPYHPA